MARKFCVKIQIFVSKIYIVNTLDPGSAWCNELPAPSGKLPAKEKALAGRLALIYGAERSRGGFAIFAFYFCYREYSDLMDVEILNEPFALYPQKALLWKSQGILLLADLHLGKINHFRRAGIPVPAKANDHNLELLVELVQLCSPSRVICLGDLFHSYYNAEWEVFGEVVAHFSTIRFDLVLGNHDIMGSYQYRRKGIHLHDTLRIGDFVLSHHPLESVADGTYNFAGHIHPGVSLRGKARQAMTFPCFYFGDRQGYLPAFGKFTGLARIRPKKEDRVYIIAENKVLMC